MNELDRILDGLIQRTSDGKLRWSRAASDEQFATSVDTISVIIGRPQELRRGTSGLPRLEIYNEHGHLAEVMQFDAPSPDNVDRFNKLRRLHAMARHSALNVQETLERLAKALEA